MRDSPVGTALLDGFTLDLWSGDVRKGGAGPVVAHLSPWQRRHRVVATELLLATEYGSGGLHLFDVAMVWPDWLHRATYFQDVRCRWNTLRWGLNKALNPYGWAVTNGETLRWALKPVGSDPPPRSRLTACTAAECLRKAAGALRRAEFDAALLNTVDALDHCGESLIAWKVIGVCAFRHQCDLDRCLAFRSAERLLQHEQRLRAACDRLRILRQREQARRPSKWQAADEHIARVEHELDTFQDIFEEARRML